MTVFYQKYKRIKAITISFRITYEQAYAEKLIAISKIITHHQFVEKKKYYLSIIPCNNQKLKPNQKNKKINNLKNCFLVLFCFQVLPAAPAMAASRMPTGLRGSTFLECDTCNKQMLCFMRL